MASDTSNPANNPMSMLTNVTIKKVTIQIAASALLSFQNFTSSLACTNIPFNATCGRRKRSFCKFYAIIVIILLKYLTLAARTTVLHKVCKKTGVDFKGVRY